jgi:MFS family permease
LSQLATYLKELDLDATNVGLMFSLTLVGDAVISIVMTTRADIWGRRKTLIISAFLSIFTGIAFASQSNFWVLLIAAVIGVISPSGNEIGPFLAIELSGTIRRSN